MDRIRYFAEMSVRRGACFGLLAIALVVVGLSAEPAMALRATAILLTLEAALLWHRGQSSGRTPYQDREVWLLLDRKHGLHESRAHEIISQIMAETFQAYAKRLAGPAAAAWIVDLGNRLIG